MPWKFSHLDKDYLVTDRWSMADASDMANIVSEIRALDGRHPKDVFGEDIPLGEISFTDWSPDTCGCAHRFLAKRNGNGEAIPHRSLKHCEAHKHLASDHAAHHAALMRENRHKNATVQALAKAHDIESHEISFEYDVERKLSVSHPAFGKKVAPQPSVN